ncbi:EndoU domain-containing protein [Bacillus sp. JZ8]
MGTIQADLNELKNLEQKTKNAKAKIDAIPGQLSFSLSGVLSELSGVWNGELEGLQQELEKSIREYSEGLGRAEQVVSKTYQNLKKADEEALKAMKKDIALNPYTSKMMYMQAGRNYAKESGMPDNIANIIFDAKWEIGYSPVKEVSAQAKAAKKEEKGWADYTLEGVSIGADFIPIVSNVKGAFEAGFGMDPFTFRKLNAVEQGIAAGAIVAGPVAKGTAKYGPKVLEAGKNLFKGGKSGGSMMPALAGDAAAFSAGGSAVFRTSDNISSVDQAYGTMMKSSRKELNTKSTDKIDNIEYQSNQKKNSESKNPMFGKDWNSYFQDTYGKKFVEWRSEVIYDISRLKNTDQFKPGALEHVLQGEINWSGKAVGFHYEGLPSQKGNVIPGTATVPNSNGVYEAKVEVNGILKTANNGMSSFFPKDMSPQQIVDSINEAYNNKSFVEGTRNTYTGKTSTGIEINMYLNKQGKIISAFPSK